MCNSTSSSVGGYGGAAAGGGGDYYCSYGLKKSKRQRLPKRGPGVAELEKILREHETQVDEENKGKIGWFSSSYFVPSPSNTLQHIPQPSFMSPSISLPPRNVPFLPDHAHFTPPLPPLNGGNGNGDEDGNSNGNANGNGSGNGNGGSNGLFIGGSGLVLPENVLMPVLQGSYMESPKLAAGLPVSAQLRNGSDQAQMFPPPPVVLETYCQFWQPPMTASAKREWTLCHENPPACSPELPCQLPSMSPNIHRVDTSSFSENVAMFNPRKTFRDTTSISSLELKMKRSVTDSRAPRGTTFVFSSPASPLPSSQICQEEFSKFKLQTSMRNRDSCEDSCRRSEPDGTGSRKPFYSFLLNEQQMGAAQTTFSSKNEKSGSRDGIDLNLKL